MRSLAAPLVLAMMILVPVASAVVDANPTTRSLDDTVTDVTAARTGGAVGGASEDPSGLGGVGTVDAVVYRLWGPAGQIIASGPADPAECDRTVTAGFDCQTHAQAIATNQDGTRVVVSSFISDSRGSIVVFADRNSQTRYGTYIAEDNSVKNEGAEVAGRVVDVAMSDSGNVVAVGTVSGIAPSQTGRVHVFSWGGAPSPCKVVQVPGNLQSVDVSGDGFVIQAGGNKPARFLESCSTTDVYVDSLPGASGVVSVDIANDLEHWSVVGLSGGSVALFSDRSNRANHHEFLLKNTNQAITAVAIRDDATSFAFGDASGDLWVYALTPTATATLGLPIAVLEGFPGPITDLAYSGDGKYLAVASTPAQGNGQVALYRVNSDSVVRVWSHSAAGALGKVAIDGLGENVVSAHGDDVTIYAAVHDLRMTVTGSTPSIRPGQDQNLTLVFRNHGNRYESATLIPTGPDGWSFSTSRSSITVPPDQQQNVALKVSVPPLTPPGTYDLKVTYQTATKTHESTVQVIVPTVRSWSLRLDSAASLAIAGSSPAVFEMTVINDGNTADTTNVQVANVPAGWTVITDPLVVDLAPGQSRAVTVSVTAPADAAQLAQATIRVSLTKDASEQALLTATVGARFAVALEVPSSFTMQVGQRDTFEVRVSNPGNAPDSFVVALGNLPVGWIAAFQNGQKTLAVADLPPGESRTIPVQIQVPTTAQADSQTQLNVRATSAGDQGQQASRNVIIAVSGAPVEDDPVPALPVLLLAAALLAVAARRRHS